MPKANVYDMTGKQVGEIELSDAIFGIEPDMVAIHEAVKNQLANRRQGTQSALTRPAAAVSRGARRAPDAHVRAPRVPRSGRTAA